MEKQINAFRLCDGAVASECKRIDAVEGQVVAAADQCFEFGDNPGTPGPSLLDLGDLAFKEPFPERQSFGTCASAIEQV
jgi:hypothetical protein